MLKNNTSITNLNHWLQDINYYIIIDKEIKIYYRNQEIFSQNNNKSMNRLTITIPNNDCQLTINIDNLIKKDETTPYQRASFTITTINQKTNVNILSTYSNKIQEEVITEYTKENQLYNKKTYLKFSHDSLTIYLHGNGGNQDNIDKAKYEISQTFPNIMTYLTSIYRYLDNSLNHNYQYEHYKLNQQEKKYTLSKNKKNN